MNYLKLLRPHQYLKNLIIFIPIFLSGEFFESDKFLITLFGFLGFSLTTSFVYIWNDIKDLDADRNHPNKKYRPIASGEISIKTAVAESVIILIASIFITATVDIRLLFLSFAYIVMNVLYNFIFKRIYLVDVFLITLGFGIRLVYGSVSSNVELTVWIFTIVYYLSLTYLLIKRIKEVEMDQNKYSKLYVEYPNLNQYLIYVCASMSIITYLFYTLENDTRDKFGSDFVVVTVIPIFVGLIRYIWLGLIGEKSKSKDSFMSLITDPLILISVSITTVLFGLFVYI